MQSGRYQGPEDGSKSHGATGRSDTAGPSVGAGPGRPVNLYSVRRQSACSRPHRSV